MPLQKVLRSLGYAMALSALGLWLYIGLAIVTGEVYVASRSTSASILSQLAPQSFLFATVLYTIGAILCSWCAYVLLRKS